MARYYNTWETWIIRTVEQISSTHVYTNKEEYCKSVDEFKGRGIEIICITPLGIVGQDGEWMVRN